MLKNSYYVAPGEIDRYRMKLINQVYNPTTFKFLLDSGLEKDMTVLEYGCRSGFSAVELAKYVGKNGKVVAIDPSQEQLDIAKKTANDAMVNNIEFILCDTAEINKLDRKFDLVYGRWTLNFYPKAEEVLHLLYENINSGGILATEAVSKRHANVFSYPHEPLIDSLLQVGIDNYDRLGLDTNLGHKLYGYLQNMGCSSIKIGTNQPILTTPEEKSLIRLTLVNIANPDLKDNLESQYEQNKMVQDLIEIEQKDTIISFLQNILISGRK